jgi:threonine/homoserine/homoserine lactone efflux protein
MRCVLSPQSLLLFVGAGLLLNLTPGPDVLYIVGRSVGQGRTAGVVSALGIAAGCLVHITAAVLGLSTLMIQLPVAFRVVQYAGAAYLVWLGVRSLSGAQGAVARAPQPAAMRRVFLQGALTNILNPKVALFFLAFLPQFVDPGRGSLPLQFALLGLIFVTNGLMVCIGYAMAASWCGRWITDRYGAGAWLGRAMGVLFIGLGARLAFGQRH